MTVQYVYIKDETVQFTSPHQFTLAGYRVIEKDIPEGKAPFMTPSGELRLKTIPQNEIDEKTLENEKRNAIQEVKDTHDTLINDTVGEHSKTYRETFFTKTLAAQAYLDKRSTALQEAALTAEAHIAERDIEALANKIVKKNNDYLLIAGIAAGWQDKSIRAIEAITSLTELDTVMTDIKRDKDHQLRRYNLIE